jgi:small subunit ribosomal protein S4
MGKPKFSRKKYETPSHPWQEDRIKEENELIKKYGLKNKREIWKAQTRLRKYRGQARELLAKVQTGEAQSKKESNQLLIHLDRMNILPTSATLDDVLTLDIETILSRRLQTLTYLKGLANTPNQARQLISHGHVAIRDRRVTVPGYMITKEEEGEIGYTGDSPLNDMMHPARPRSDFTPIPSKREEKPAEKQSETPTHPESPLEWKTKPETNEEKTKIMTEPKLEEPSEAKVVEEKPKEEQTTKMETSPAEGPPVEQPKTVEEKLEEAKEEKSEPEKYKDKKGEGK